MREILYECAKPFLVRLEWGSEGTRNAVAENLVRILRNFDEETEHFERRFRRGPEISEMEKHAAGKRSFVTTTPLSEWDGARMSEREPRNFWLRVDIDGVPPEYRENVRVVTGWVLRRMEEVFERTQK